MNLLTLKLALIALPVFFAIDMLWLGVIARQFYRDQLGALLRSEFNWWAAIAFYLLFIVALVYFVIAPALKNGSLSEALFRGAFFGLVTYATYDLTNLATLKNWPLLLTGIDMLWGMILAASVAGITYTLASRIGL
jgi:uncharacterized membrane protein